MSFERLESFNVVFSKLQNLINVLQSILATSEGYFKQIDFQNKLNINLQDNEKAEKLSKFILSSYSGRLIQPGVIESNAFLQQRKSIDGLEYRVFNTQYLATCSPYLNTFHVPRIVPTPFVS